MPLVHPLPPALVEVVSPVYQTEQRLRQLKELRSRIDREIRDIEAEEAYRARKAAQTKGQPRSRRHKAEDRVTKHLERLGVTAHDVKAWAVTAGLTDTVRRGRIKAELVDAYETAHPTGARP